MPVLCVPFQSFIFSFFSLFIHHRLWLQGQCWIEVMIAGIHVLFQSQKESSVDCYRAFVNSFYQAKEMSFYSWFVRSFHEYILNVIKCFFYIYWNCHVIFFIICECGESNINFFFICSEFCHTLEWNSHGFTCVPHPDPPSHLPLHPLTLGFPSAPGPSACLMHPTWAGDLFHPRYYTCFNAVLLKHPTLTFKLKVFISWIYISEIMSWLLLKQLSHI